MSGVGLISAGSAAARSRETVRLLRKHGARGFAQRVARVAYHKLGASALDFPLRYDDVADSRGLELAVPATRPAPGTPLGVGWICTPPGAGSGGHTTMFRMVEALEAAGHTCVIYLYDVFDGELERHTDVIRGAWPGVRAEIRSVAAGLAPLDAYVATGWPTAHVLASRSEVATRRLYFIQDFEPWFYPQGAEYALAEDTYRFGFRPITVGRMLADLLHDQFGATADVAEFGWDDAVYRCTEPSPREGVVFYAKRDTARRGFALGLLALREFHRRHPDQEIHLFGDPTVQMPFPVTNHGHLTPAQLSELYNRCAAGLALSFTNVSLVPDEMLACGVVPVTGESRYARASLDNPHVRWAPPTPLGLADALSDVVTGKAAAPAEISASVRPVAWDNAQRATVRAIEDEVYGPR
ncbi:rhamnosyltransferase WsaF family glycosyltransferase [Paractinoplanes deccanensis]|uniref:rhamnosyltransferase WsaF family glycosyltransferase n=1 Tax=Paractinoplanes deccanensis TaxID=113561 RepID=UPI0031D480A1